MRKKEFGVNKRKSGSPNPFWLDKSKTQEII